MADLTPGAASASTAEQTPQTPEPASTAETVETPNTTETDVKTPEGDTTESTDFGSIDDPALLEAILEEANKSENERKKPEPEQATENKGNPPEDGGDDNNDPEGEVVTDLDKKKEPAKNFRFRTEDPKKRQFLTLLREEPDADVHELARRAGYELPKSEAAAAENVQQQQQQQQQETKIDYATDERLKAQRDKVAELKTKLKSAEENFQSTAEILDELQDAKIDLREATKSLQQSDASAAQFETGRQASIASALKLSPDIGKPGSPQAEEIAREVAWLESQDSDILSRSDYPMEVLKRVAARNPALFPNVVKGKPAPAPKTETPAAKQPPGARPANGSVESGAQATQPKLTSEQALAKIDDLSLEELEALSNQTGEMRSR